MSDFMEFCVCVLAPFGGLIAFLAFIAVGADYASCRGFQTATGYPVQYTGFQCYAQVDGKWVPQQYVFGNAVEARVK